jgi:hypothetical protein
MALLALVGTMLMTVLLVWAFVSNVVNWPAGRGRASGALLVIHQCVCLLHPDGVLFRVPSSAVEVIVCVRSTVKLASNPEYRRRGRSLWTAMLNAFFCPIGTTSFLPRVMPV